MRGDPRTITAKFAGKCGKPGCQIPVQKGDSVFYYPSTRTVLGAKCGHADEASRAFDAARFDEESAPQAL